MLTVYFQYYTSSKFKAWIDSVAEIVETTFYFSLSFLKQKETRVISSL